MFVSTVYLPMAVEPVVSGIDTITVLPFPSATLQSDTISLCLGQTDTLRIKFEGPGPYTFQYAANLDTMPPVTTTDTLIKIPITPPLGQTVYMLTHVQGDPCGGVFQGRVLVNVANVPTANLTGDTTICAGESTSLGSILQAIRPLLQTIRQMALLNPRIPLFLIRGRFW